MFALNRIQSIDFANPLFTQKQGIPILWSWMLHFAQINLAFGWAELLL